MRRIQNKVRMNETGRDHSEMKALDGYTIDSDLNGMQLAMPCGCGAAYGQLCAVDLFDRREKRNLYKCVLCTLTHSPVRKPIYSKSDICASWLDKNSVRRNDGFPLRGTKVEKLTVGKVTTADTVWVHMLHGSLNVARPFVGQLTRSGRTRF